MNPKRCVVVSLRLCVKFPANISSSLYFRGLVAQFIFNMKRTGFSFLLAGLIIFLAIPRGLFAETELPKFEEIFQLLRTNVGGLTETELNRAAVQGLLQQLSSRVVLVTNSASTTADSNLLSKVSVLENSFAYFRVGKIESGLNDTFKTAYQKLFSTNKIKGMVLDLRYANGIDYAASAKTADLFIKNQQPLLRWGDSSAEATAKTNAIAVPVAILINHQTAGAAEALAAMLREGQIGLVLGTNTAGQASVFQEFPLSTGQKIKIASAQVKLGNGKTIAKEGVKPDIEINLSAEEGKAFYEDSYRAVPRQFSSADRNAEPSETNRPRRRLNEAELVRLQREGTSADEEFSVSGSKELKKRLDSDGNPVLSDPVIIRALDLLKGLAVIQQTRRP
ncbi:MAG: S41 family peptidase [Verrucomicrobiota bacterium]